MNNLPVRGCHPLRLDFPEIFRFIIHTYIAVLQPHTCRNRYGLGCSPFARRYSGNRCFFILLRLLRCFSSAGLPTIAGVTVLLQPGCPIRICADQFLFANPRTFSQLTTSFVASKSLGIPHAPLFTFFNWVLNGAFCLIAAKSPISSSNMSMILAFRPCEFAHFQTQRTPLILPGPLFRPRGKNS